jgi:hypothetical protein
VIGGESNNYSSTNELDNTQKLFRRLEDNKSKISRNTESINIDNGGASVLVKNNYE